MNRNKRTPRKTSDRFPHDARHETHNFPENGQDRFIISEISARDRNSPTNKHPTSETHHHQRPLLNKEFSRANVGAIFHGAKPVICDGPRNAGSK